MGGAEEEGREEFTGSLGRESEWKEVQNLGEMRDGEGGKMEIKEGRGKEGKESGVRGKGVVERGRKISEEGKGREGGGWRMGVVPR